MSRFSPGINTPGRRASCSVAQATTSIDSSGRDLFEPNKPPVILDRDDRLKLVPLVQVLLTESLTPPPPTSTEEAGDDQAHP